MMIDDEMNSDDWVDYNLDYHLNMANNMLNTDIVGSKDFDVNIKIPSEKKHSQDTQMANATNNSNNTTSETFVKLLDSMNFKILHSNFKKFHKFLENNISKEMCLPYVSKQFEDIFKTIVQDIEVLRSQSLGNNFRYICNEILQSVHRNQSVFFLSYLYEPRKEFIHKKVLVIKKIYFTEDLIDETSRMSSKESLLLSSEASSEADPDELLKRSPTPEYLSFKIHCLQAALAFVKNHTKNKIEFPELESEQADFIEQLLHCVVCSTNFDKEFEIKDLFRALWEAVKIHSLKYEFKINSVDIGGKKSLVFEKVVKEKPADTAVNINQIINQTPQDTIPAKLETNLSNSEKNDSKPVHCTQEKGCFLSRFPRSFVLGALNAIIDFLSNEETLRVSFAPKNPLEQRFYRNVINWCQIAHVPTSDPEYKHLLEKVSQLLIQTKVRVPAWKKNKINLDTGIKEISYIKKPKPQLCSEVSTTAESISKKNKRKNSLNSDISSEKSVTGLDLRLRKNKKIKLQDVINSDKAAVTPISDLLNKSLRKKKKNKKQRWDIVETSHESSTEGNVSNRTVFKSAVIKVHATDSKQLFNERPASLDRQKEGHAGHEPKTIFKSTVTKVDATRNEPIGKERPASLDRLKEQHVPNRIVFKSAVAKVEDTRNETLGKDRPESLDRLKERHAGQHVPKSKGKDIESVRPSIASRQMGRYYREDQHGKERLLEALSVPVQSEKAMKMMQGMGWSGGALGARGNGITEPIMPSLAPLSGAGFGHKERQWSSKKFGPVVKISKLKATTKIGGNWLSEPTESDEQAIEDDVIVQETKKLLKSKVSFDSLKYMMKISEIEPPRVKYFRLIILNWIFTFVSNDETERLLKCNPSMSRKHVRICKDICMSLKGKDKLRLPDEEMEVYGRILEKLKNKRGVVIEIYVTSDHKEIKLMKLKTQSEDLPSDPRMNQLNVKHKEKKYKGPASVKANDDDMLALFDKLEPTCPSKKSFKALKFRVLILKNILKFIRSKDEELEVSLNNVVQAKQKNYIESTIEAVNTRLKFGGTPTEIGLSVEIKNCIDDVFIGICFNHSYTSFSLIKYSSSKTSEDVSKSKRKTFVNLGNFINDSSSDTDMITEHKNKDNKLTEYNNNQVEIGNQDNASEDLKSKAGDAAINPDAPKNDANSQLIGNELTDINDKGHFDINIKTVDCNNKLVIDKENVVASNYKVSDKNEKVADDIEENDNTINNKDIIKTDNKPVISNNPETMENDFSDTSTKNKDEIINDLDDNDDGLDTDNIDVSMDSNDIEKILEICNEEEDNIERVPDKVKDIDEQMDVDDDERQTKTGRHNEDDSNEINKQEQLLQENCIDEDKLLIQEDEVVKEINDRAICIENETLRETTEPHEAIKIIEEKSVKAVDSQTAAAHKANFDKETDCSINQIIDLRKHNCDNGHFVGGDFEMDNSKIGKIDSEIKNVYIVPKNYPYENITKEKANDIKKIFSDNIVKGKELPLLMCHGVENGAIIFSCYNNNTFDWVMKTTRKTRDFEVLDTQDVRKMALKCYYIPNFDVKYLFSMIELYNKELSTKEWVIEKTVAYDKYVMFIIRMDSYSINFINASDLTLFAGVDKVHFSHVWD